MRKLLILFGFVVAASSSLGAFAPQALADPIQCPLLLTGDNLIRKHGECRQACHIVEKNQNKFKACQDLCDKTFDTCEDKRAEADKKNKT
jgi:hypothetical protein